MAAKKEFIVTVAREVKTWETGEMRAEASERRYLARYRNQKEA